MNKPYAKMIEDRKAHLVRSDDGPPGKYEKIFGIPLITIRRASDPEENWAVCHECAHHDLDHGDWPGWLLDFSSNRIWVEGKANRRGLNLAVPPAMLAHYKQELADGNMQYVVWDLSEKTRLPRRIIRQAIHFFYQNK